LTSGDGRKQLGSLSSCVSLKGKKKNSSTGNLDCKRLKLSSRTSAASPHKMSTSTSPRETPLLSSLEIHSPEEAASHLQSRSRQSPEWYFREILGINPWAKQIEIADSVNRYEKTLCYSCVASGKSFIGGAIIPWWLTSRHPSRVFIIAPTERQIRINLWSELSRVYYSARIPLGGEMQTLDWKLDTDWLAKGFSPKDAMGVFGLHAPNDLIVFDDAQGIAQDVFDAFENASASGTAHYLFLCNPAVVSGTVYEAITSRRKEFHSIQIDAFHTPNVQANRVVVPGLIVKDKVDEWVQKYGWDSDFVRVKVRALVPKQEPDTLIPLDWLEMAKTREVIQHQGPVILGVDVARFGDDESVICVKDGRQLLPIQNDYVLQGNDTMQVAGRVLRAYRGLGAIRANIDEIGVGGGVVDRLKEQAINVHGINVAEKPFDEERFVNLRSEMWWAARESVDPKNPAAMAIPNDDALCADLSAMKYSVDSAGRIKVESKEETKKRLKRSPDRGDAYALAVFESYLAIAKPVSVYTQNSTLPRRPAWLK